MQFNSWSQVFDLLRSRFIKNWAALPRVCPFRYKSEYKLILHYLLYPDPTMYHSLAQCSWSQSFPGKIDPDAKGRSLVRPFSFSARSLNCIWQPFDAMPSNLPPSEPGDLLLPTPSAVLAPCGQSPPLPHRHALPTSVGLRELLGVPYYLLTPHLRLWSLPLAGATLSQQPTKEEEMKPRGLSRRHPLPGLSPEAALSRKKPPGRWPGPYPAATLLG